MMTCISILADVIMKHSTESMMTAWIEGMPVAHGEALRAAGQLLAEARLPIVAGLVCDVDAIRAAHQLAFALGAVVDSASPAALRADLDALASAGAMMTTPAETLGRADLVLAVGATNRAAFTGELGQSGPKRGRAAGSGRTVISIGDTRPLDTARARHVASNLEELPVVIATLRALIKEHAVAPPIDPDLAAAADALRAASFGVALYDPAELGPIGVDMLLGLVKDLNAATRFTSLPWTENLQQRAALQVSVWTTGDALPIGYGRGFPEQDPWRFDSERLVTANEADAVLWLASLPAPRPAWLKDLPAVALLGEADGSEAQIVIEVAVPGETADGVLWDEHRATLTHRKAKQPSGNPSAAAVLASLQPAAQERRGAAC